MATDHESIPNIGAAQIYPYTAAPSAADLANWLARGNGTASGTFPGRIRPDSAAVAGGPGGVAALARVMGINQPGGGPANVLAVVPAVAGAAAAIVPSVEDLTPGVLQWALAEAIGGHSFGTVVTCGLPLVKNQRAVHNWPASGNAFIKCIDGQDLASFRSAPSGWDFRLLPVLKSPSGLPQRTLSSLVRDSKQEKADWIKMVPGDVRSAEWCLGYLESEGVGFEGHHERVRQLAGVDGGAWGMSEHFQVMVQLKYGLQVDQVDGTNLLLIETLFRRAQTIEFAWSERIKERENKLATGNRLSVEEQGLFGGITRFASCLMICPLLLDFVRAEVEKDARLHKALRLAREEKVTEPKGKKGGKNKNEDE